MYRYGLIYRQVIRLPPFDVCKACPRNVGFKTFIKKFFVISFFSKIQELTFKEVTIPTTKLLSLFRSGDHRSIYYSSLIKNDSLSHITTDFTNTSPDKNVFGWTRFL